MPCAEHTRQNPNGQPCNRMKLAPLFLPCYRGGMIKGILTTITRAAASLLLFVAYFYLVGGWSAL